MERQKRAARACDECRRLKERCEGGFPCRRCSHFQRLCEARGPDPRARGFIPYVPTKAKPERSGYRELIERSKYMERILQHTIEGISLDTASLAKMAERLDPISPRRLVASRDSKDAEALGIEDEAYTIQPVGYTTTHFSGEFSYWNFSIRVKSHIESQLQGPETQKSNLSDDPNHESDFPRAHQLRPGHKLFISAISSCPPRHVAAFLVQIFFRYVEDYLFFVEESWVHEQLALLYDEPQSFAKDGVESTIAILLTIFAIGTQYAHLESSIQQPSIDAHQTPGFSEDSIGTTFYQQAIRLLPEIIETSSLESVQACLLFGYYALPVDTSGLGFIYISLTIRLAMQNGMHRKCTNDAFSPAMIETRNRVWWTAYVLERKISIFHGRPLSVLRSDIDANMPLSQDNLPSKGSCESFSFAQISIKLAHFLEDLFHDIKILRSCPKPDVSKMVSQLMAKKSELTTWWASLPLDAVDADVYQTPQIRSRMHIKLEYCLVRMFVGRPFLLKKETSHSETNSPGPKNDHHVTGEPVRDSATIREDLIADSVQAAIEALGICQHLRDSGSGLARASYLEYSSCRASLLVLIASSISNMSEQFRKPLCEGLSMIRDMSASGESARSEVALIESLERALAHLHARVQQQCPSNDDDAEVLAASSYDAFRHWGAKMTGANSLDSSTRPTADLLARQVEDEGGASWRHMQLDFQAHPAMDINFDIFGGYDSLVEMSFFENQTSPSAGWPTYTEAEILGNLSSDAHYAGTHGA